MSSRICKPFQQGAVWRLMSSAINENISTLMCTASSSFDIILPGTAQPVAEVQDSFEVQYVSGVTTAAEPSSQSVILFRIEI